MTLPCVPKGARGGVAALPGDCMSKSDVIYLRNRAVVSPISGLADFGAPNGNPYVTRGLR